MWHPAGTNTVIPFVACTLIPEFETECSSSTCCFIICIMRVHIRRTTAHPFMDYELLKQKMTGFVQDWTQNALHCFVSINFVFE
jgi:hypothetical protein